MIKRYVGSVACVLVVISIAVTVAFTMPTKSGPPPAQSVQYLGVYEADTPGSYTGIDQFAKAIGQQPNLVSYYSPWLEPFHADFAGSAARRGAITLVQIDATNISIASIAAGQYDSYLYSYAAAVKAFGRQVILSFGHEMNGYWYTWGNQGTPPSVFRAAWRHIVTVFRVADVANVTWLWTVNVIEQTPLIPNPAPWWPGSSYVDWVGIDGYYYSPSSNFAQVFGPTIVEVRKLTNDPILIAETGANQTADQQAKVTDLFAGINTYGLLGFLWYDRNYDGQEWRITSPQVFATFRQEARAYLKPVAPLSPASQQSTQRSRGSSANP
jgi:mannan endo-1,4-beta-mannosidase